MDRNHSSPASLAANITAFLILALICIGAVFWTIYSAIAGFIGVILILASRRQTGAAFPWLLAIAILAIVAGAGAYLLSLEASYTITSG